MGLFNTIKKVVAPKSNKQLTSAPPKKAVQPKTEFKPYTIKEQYKYFCNRSKKGATDKTGKPLSDMQRGIAIGRAKQIGEGAKMAKRYKSK